MAKKPSKTRTKPVKVDIFARHDDPEYWRECLARIDDKDLCAKFLVIGKIKQLMSKQQPNP